MEPLIEPSRSRSKREYSDGPDFSENHETDSDRRKLRSSKSRKHSSNYSDSLEDSRKKSSDYEEDHEGNRRESSSSHRSSRSSKRSPEERERRRDEEREDWERSRGKEREREREESRSSDRREKEKEKSTPRHHRSDESHDSRNGKSHEYRTESGRSGNKEERYDDSGLVVDKSESRERRSRERRENRRSLTPPDELDRVYSDSDHERNERDEDYAEENRSYRAKERQWSERNRDSEGSRDYWRNRGQERPDFNSRYRKDSRARSETGKPIPGFGNRNENSDSIEIRPSRNLDFAREGSDFESNEEQNSGRDSQMGRYNRGSSMNPNSQNMNMNMNMNSPMSNQFGPKGGRGMRGGLGRGRPNNRDNNNNNMNNNNMNNMNNNMNPQRMGVQNIQMPMMGPPFGPLGLPPGPLGPPPLGFIPPFGGPLVWPPGRGMDVNLLSNLPPIPPPPIQVPPRFNPNLTPLQLAQPNNSNKNMQNMSTPSREMTPLDKPNNNNTNAWVPNRNTGPAGKAPSRGEQNDYSQNFVDTGMRPQNFIRELELTSVVEDYPKLRELIQRKDEIVANAASPPMYFKCDLKEHVLTPEFFGTKFDVILVDPPWEEYVHRAPGITDHIEYWTMEEIMNLKLEAIADTPSFIFLWVGDGVGLEQGRQCLKKWGFRRCEDICWVKTNKKSAGPGLRHDSHTLFQHSKEHCLMGIKGTVRRSTDGHIIHANIDTDIIIAEEEADGSTKKPEDMYRIIEHFALGKRRLELFGEDHNIRPGWLTVGKGLSSSNFNKETYTKSFSDKEGKVWQGGGGRNPPPEAPHLVVTTPEIESLRPKSPPAKGQAQNQNPSLPPSALSRRNSNSNISEPATPAHWGPNGPSGPNGPFELGEGSGNNGMGSSNNNVGSGMFGGEGFGYGHGHGEFDPHRMPGLL